MLEEMLGDSNMRIRATDYRRLAIAVCLATLLSLSITAAHASTAPLVCAVEDLTLEIGQKFSHMTQEQGNIYTLTNRGKVVCLLHGYPRVSYYDKTRHLLPFKYTQSSSIYMTHTAPKTVVLLVGSRAFFFIAGASTCDFGGTPIEATTIHVYLPNVKKPIIGRATAYPDTGGAIYYCKGTTIEAGRQLDVSPVRADIHHF